MSLGSGVRWGLLAEILPQGQYALARSAMNVSVGVTQVLGFAIGGSLLQLLSVEQVLWVAAALAALSIPITWTGIGDRPARRTARTGLRETWRGNRILLTLPSTRPLLLALTIPNGLVAGCEALFVPYAGNAAAALFVAGAAGMLVGDVLVGRVLDASQRRSSARWLRWWLAVPFLFFVFGPDIPVAVLLAGCACLGYAATLAQQELLVELTPRRVRGSCHLSGARRTPGGRGRRGDRPRARHRRARRRLRARLRSPDPSAGPSHPTSTGEAPPSGRDHEDRNQREELLKMGNTRKLVVQQWVTVDNVAAEEDGGLSFVSGEPFSKTDTSAFKASLMGLIDSVDTMILGENTYNQTKDYWPYADDQGEYGEKLNNLTKYVASSKLHDAPWGEFPAATVTRDPANTIRDLKDQHGKDIWLWGSLKLMHSLMDAGLVDEVRMLVCPASLGKRTRVFADRQDLVLVEATAFENGVALLRYEIDNNTASER
jgi:dihydrofolate reductase